MTAQIFDAVRTPLIKGERTVSKTTRSGKTVTDHHSYAIPAWFVAGGVVALAFAAWLSGIGLHAEDTTDKNGNPAKKLVLYDRPRFDPSFKLF